MTKDEAILIMVNSMNEDNREMGKLAGLTQEELEVQITQSQQSLSFMMSNAYDKLKEAGIIA